MMTLDGSVDEERYDLRTRSRNTEQPESAERCDVASSTPLLALQLRCPARTHVGELSERSTSAQGAGWVQGGRTATDGGSHGGGVGLVGGRGRAFWLFGPAARGE